MQPGEDLGLHRLGPDEAEVGFHAREGIGGEAVALLEREAHLVVPVDVVGNERDQLGVECRRCVEVGTDERSSAAFERVGAAPEAGSQPADARSTSGSEPSFSAVSRSIGG